jgi:hypothetical protein
MSEENNLVEEEKNEKNGEWKDWSRHYTNRVTWGVALILLGGLFLLDTFNLAPIHFYNWWAIFIMVPGINFLITATQRYQQEREFTESVRRSGFRGILLVLIALTFFLNIDWGIMFSLLLIGGGLYLLLMRR